MKENTQNKTIPWGSRNALVVSKESIKNSEEDIALCLKNIPKIILHIITSTSGFKWAIVDTINVFNTDLFKFYNTGWFGYPVWDWEVLNIDKQKELSGSIHKYVKSDILSTIEMQWDILEHEQDAFLYLYENQLLKEKHITKALEVFFKLIIESILEIVPERDPDKIMWYGYKQENESNKFLPEEKLSKDDNKILAHMLRKQKLPQDKKDTIFWDSSLFKNYNKGQIYENHIKTFLPEDNLIKEYIQKIIKTN